MDTTVVIFGTLIFTLVAYYVCNKINNGPPGGIA